MNINYKTLLTPRLNLVADRVSKDDSVVDVGCDHGYLAIHLVSRGLCKKIIASDIKEGPVSNAKKNFKKYGVYQKIDLRLGGGLDTIEQGEADTAVIAGMGGELISQIIQKGKDKGIAKFILQPMSKPERLRKFLYENTYKILYENLACENQKLYSVIVAIPGKEETSECNCYISKALLNSKSPFLLEYVSRLTEDFKGIISSVENARDKSKLNQLKLWYSELCEIKRGIQNGKM